MNNATALLRQISAGASLESRAMKKEGNALMLRGNDPDPRAPGSEGGGHAALYL